MSWTGHPLFMDSFGDGVGQMREAFLMDVLDVRARFGDKYDSAIAEAAAYMECLNQHKDKYNLPERGRRRRRR